MRITSRENNFYEESFLDFHQLDDEIAIVEVDGKDVFLDPGDKYSPYGLLDWRHTMCGGYRQTVDKPAFLQTPAPSYKDARVRRIARLNMLPDFSVNGRIRVIFGGFYGTMRRQEAARTDEEGRKKILEDAVKEWLPVDSEVKLDNVPNWKDVEADLSAEFQVSASLASNAGKRILMPAHVFHFGQKAMFPHSERVNGIYLYYPSRETDEIVLTIPAGMIAESIPQKDTVKLDYAMYMAEYTGRGNTITVVRDMANNGIVFGREQYGEIKGFYDKVKADDEQQIILRSNGNVAAGN
jgi:hypothetical protein